jgi:DNA-binding NtrC family response regulator
VRTRLESEFFADEDVPFNGEQHRRRDSLEIANGGTVFLDGVAGISLRTQARLLPLLEEREIRRGDGKRPDIRFVAATCNDLEGLIDEGRLRPDFATRLNVFQIALPPLRERKEDIPLLVEHFIRKCAAAMNKKMAQVSTRTMNLLQRCNWPGNVRELENAVERAMVAAQSPELREEDFALRLPYPVSTARTWEEAERNHILRILEECAGSQKRAAEVLAINRTTLHNKLKSYGWKKTRAKTDS